MRACSRPAARYDQERSATLPRIIPVPLVRLHAVFDHPDWAFEFNYDGVRALADLENGAAPVLCPTP